VYKALDRRMAEAGAAEPWVAIKVLSPQLSKNGTALRALQQEAAKGRCLSHAHIVRFIDLDREDDLYFIVMEWLDGKTLAEMLDSADGKAMGTDQAIGIVRQLASALGYAHRCGIVHADVKPANVMVLPNGDAKLFDFGVARVRQTQKLSRDDFDPGVLGALTPAYSSMQVLTGEEPVPADDVFSLGCLFYRLVAGHRVFGPRNAAEAAEEGMTPQQPQGLTDGQWRALKKAISFSRVTRFQSMPEFMNELENRSVVSIDIGPPGHLDEDDAGGSRSWLFGLVALLLLLGFAIYEFGFSDPFGWTRQAGSWIDDQVAAFSDDAEEARVPAETIDDGIIDLPAEADDPIAEVGGAPEESAGSEPASGDVTDAPGAVEAADVPQAAVTATEAAARDDLPPADVEVNLNNSSVEPAPVAVTLREDGGPTLVDVRRSGNLDLPLRLRVEEVGYTGNRSPWASRQYTIANDGNIEMSPGEGRARLSLEMASDTLRESDQLSTLRVRSPDSTATQYATLEVTLEDDDQRSFESGLPVNTVGFATNQIAVRESDPVVQIDVSRFNPDDTQIVIGYTVSDIAAKEGEDYFAPGGYSVSFGPGQRSARLLIPLVQDSLREGDEAFTVELATRDQEDVPDVFERIVVTIRDDDR
jgi:serine/threonine protein kinase